MFQTQTNTVLSLLTQNVDKWTSVKSFVNRLCSDLPWQAE